ncbi:hypothetical protein K438DRAFT_1795104 [Mycena galopus ATCC 62051]|nr:hypothetical protein K438DRAFT_1795104 [Mycena galopus ATCC 62051]
MQPTIRNSTMLHMCVTIVFSHLINSRACPWVSPSEPRAAACRHRSHTMCWWVCAVSHMDIPLCLSTKLILACVRATSARRRAR